MARLNPKRRLLAKQQATLQSALVQRGLDDNAQRLQSGPVRSCLGGDFTRKGYNGTMRGPRDIAMGNTKATPTRTYTRVIMPTFDAPDLSGTIGAAKPLKG